MAHEHNNSWPPPANSSRVGDLLRDIEDTEEATTQIEKDALAHLLHPDRSQPDVAARPAVPRSAVLRRRPKTPPPEEPSQSIAGTGFSPTDEYALPSFMRSVIAQGATHKAAPEPTAELPVDFLFPGRSRAPHLQNAGADATEQFDMPKALNLGSPKPKAIAQRDMLRLLILSLSLMLIAAFGLLLWVLFS